jgi:hypothetical protein
MTNTERNSPLRPVLWALVFVSAVANGVAQSIGLHPLVGVGFGVVTLAAVAALIAGHYRQRRTP